MALFGHPLLFFVLCLSICLPPASSHRPVPTGQSPHQLPASSRPAPASSRSVPGQLSASSRTALGQFPVSSWPALGQPAAIYSRVGNSSAQTVGAQAFRTLDFRHFEHKIGIFVRFLPSEPPFSAFRAQNQGFCARRTGKVALGILKLASGIPKVVFLQITEHTSKM